MRMNSLLWARPTYLVAVVVMATVMAAAVPVLADDSRDEGESRNATMVALEKRIAAGDLEYRDPKTGDVVVATEGRIAELRDELAPHFGQPPVFNRTIAADGTVGSEIGGAIRDVFVVRTNLDGTRETACVRELDAAVAFVVGLHAPSDGGADRRAPAVE